MLQPPRELLKLTTLSVGLLALTVTACATAGSSFQPPTQPQQAGPAQRTYADEAAPGAYWADGVPPGMALATDARLAVDLESGRTELIPGGGWHRLPGKGWTPERSGQ